MYGDRNDTTFTTSGLDYPDSAITASPVFSTNSTTDDHASLGYAAITESVAQLNISSTETSWPDYVKLCPSNAACERLGADCIQCDFNTSCHYGRNLSVVCRARPLVVCTVRFLNLHLSCVI